MPTVEAATRLISPVSMKSGLEGRNNAAPAGNTTNPRQVSMKSGLEGRNNHFYGSFSQFMTWVSMKSGLEGRNNQDPAPSNARNVRHLNEVRPGRPEQSNLGPCQRAALLMSQ